MVADMFRREGMLRQRGGNALLIDRLPMARSTREGTRTPTNFKRYQVMALDQTNAVCYATYEEACYELGRREGRTRRWAA